MRDAGRMTPPTSQEASAQLDALMRAARAFSGIVASSLAEVDDQVTPQQLRVLVAVATHRRANASTVSDALDLHPSSATRLCDRLVGAGLLDRRSDPGDRRQVALRLTESGLRLLDVVMEHRRSRLTEVLRGLTEDERRDLERCLTLFSDAVGEPSEADWHPHDVRVSPSAAG
jgi:DNA-binding MarR family transcriptional regulator